MYTTREHGTGHVSCLVDDDDDDDGDDGDGDDGDGDGDDGGDGDDDNDCGGGNDGGNAQTPSLDQGSPSSEVHVSRMPYYTKKSTTTK